MNVTRNSEEVKVADITHKTITLTAIEGASTVKALLQAKASYHECESTLWPARPPYFGIFMNAGLW